MNGDSVHSAADVAARICSSDSLPSFPPVLTVIMAECTDDDVDFGELGALVSSDPALAARILAMANSCLLGGRARVSSIRSALTRLGLRLTHATVLGFALTSRMDSSNGFDADRFWRYSLATSNAARILARKNGAQDADEALAAGILQDVGMLALQCVLPEQYKQVLVEYHETAPPLHEIEARICGTTHMAVGTHLLQQWGLPEELYEPICHHHCADEEALGKLPAPVRNMAELLRVGDMVAQVFVGPDRNIRRAAVLREFGQRYGFNAQTAERMLEQVSTVVERVAAAFELDPAELPSYDEIRASGVRKMVQLAAEMEAGFREYQVKAGEARDALSELENQHREVSRQAAYDDLTDALARGEFMKQMDAALTAAADEGSPVALLFLDVDHFKWVNDKFGHAAGDTILTSFAQYLVRSLRRGDLVGRYGGDEFTVLLPGIDLEAALKVAKRILQRAASTSPEWLEDFEGITASAGLVHVESVTPELSRLALLEEADQCLYMAKSDGRNCIRYHTL